MLIFLSYHLGTAPAASIAAKTSFAGFVVDNTGAGDLFTASKSGATKFTILNNGNIQFAGTTSNLLTLAYAGGVTRPSLSLQQQEHSVFRTVLPADSPLVLTSGQRQVTQEVLLPPSTQLWIY